MSNSKESGSFKEKRSTILRSKISRELVCEKVIAFLVPFGGRDVFIFSSLRASEYSISNKNVRTFLSINVWDPLVTRST